MSQEHRATDELVVQGTPASHGIAYGRVFLYMRSDVEVPAYTVEPAKRVEEVARFESALLETRKQISGIQSQVEKNLGPEEARIFDAHLMVLEDQALIGETIREFEASRRNIETCFNEVSQKYIRAFDQIDDEYLRERAGDLRDVAQRVLNNLLGQASRNLSQLADKRVVVANEIAPSDSASIDSSQALAIVTDSGGRTSHAVIVARSMRIPAVVGMRDLTSRVKDGEWVIVDGYEGIVIVRPTEQTLFRYGQIERQKKGVENLLREANRQPAVTNDGVSVTLMANIEKVDEVALVKEYLAAGVGLFRTEFLFLNSQTMPTEEEQFVAYRELTEALAPEPVIIRTLDLGGDKPITGNPHLFPKEENPFMGFRAIRFCLEHPDIFKAQLRAILRASAHGPIRLMFPMISGADELARAKAVLQECREELGNEKQGFNDQLEVGTMIELPSAAATADLLAGNSDFFSIGTNDLIQYLFAVDRGNDRVAHLYEPTHPAVLRTIQRIVEVAHARGIPVGVCGEMAGDPVYVPLLLGLGVDSLSMTPPLIPSVKFLVRAMSMADAKELAREALTLGSAKAIFERCDEFYRSRVRMEGLAGGGQ
jgi:phosphotransferase system enzyme I (PtsI)